MNNEQPDSDEVEVSLFGPGIGESIVVHLGDGEWMIIDSCLDSQTHQPVALQYLEALGVDVANQVKLIVATHWHDDHIKGLASIFRVAITAKFVNSAAYQLRDLARVVKVGESLSSSSQATAEYGEIIDLLMKRKKQAEHPGAVGPTLAAANKRLLALTDSKRSIKAEVFSLSPADGVFHRAYAELDEALSAIKRRHRPGRMGPNQRCVTLWLKIGMLDVLLGADLEHVPGVTEGWRAIIESPERPEGQAGIFKVAHHGSKNADCPECWTTLLGREPVALITSYTPSRLPGRDDLARLCGQTNHVYLAVDRAATPLCAENLLWKRRLGRQSFEDEP